MNNDNLNHMIIFCSLGITTAMILSTVTWNRNKNLIYGKMRDKAPLQPDENQAWEQLVNNYYAD